MSNTKHARPKKLKSALCLDAYGDTIEVRCMSVCEGWAMVRRPGGTPFVVRASEVFAPPKREDYP